MRVASEIDQPPAACKTDAACMPQNEEQYSCLRPLLSLKGRIDTITNLPVLSIGFFVCIAQNTQIQ